MRWCSCALVLCMVMLGSCVRDDEPKGVKEYVKVGDRLPRFSVKLLDGTEVNNATWEGKALVLVFFSTKCSDCQRELLLFFFIAKRSTCFFFFYFVLPPIFHTFAGRTNV